MKGDLVGGYDILLDMYKNKELERLLETSGLKKREGEE